VAVTEKPPRGEMDRYVELLRPLETRAQISMALARQIENQSAGAPKSPNPQAGGEEAEADLQAAWRKKR